ncbi:MAG: type II toxin-antitoxin system VapC family toxin [Chloroflexi bacterium]|nr:type II toxin-antitoxin system VapC family toxin [Chloroflexota bacterium]
MIVVDTNIIAYLLIKGEQTQNAQQLLTYHPDWTAPALWRHEFLNILATFVNHGGVSTAQALVLWQKAQSLMVNRELEISLSDALILAITSKISAYDAQFVILAKNLNCPLITEDKKLQKTVAEALSMQDFLTS